MPIVLPAVHELSLVGVADAGVPNQERIILRPMESVNLAPFGLFLGFTNPDGSARPLLDNFFWFGEVIVSPPSWIIVYTGPGEFQQSKLPDREEQAYVYHWGKPATVFGQGMVPLLFRLGAFVAGGAVPAVKPHLPTQFPQHKG